MMKELRKRMTLFLWLVVIAFILFIFLQWGMNVAGKRNGGRNITIIAKVNGIPIGTRIYIEKRSEIINNLRDTQNLTYLDPLMERIIDENAFEELVQKAILLNEIKKNDIYVTDNEVTVIIKNAPPKEVLEDSSMYTFGEFDFQKYLELLLNPANRYWLYEQEKNIRETYPINKLQSMYSSGIKVTQPEVLKFYQEESLKVKVKYIAFRLENHLDMVSLSEGEIKDYYEVHKSEYQVEEGIKIKGVSFEVKPSLTDEMEVKREIDDIYDLYIGGMNFDTLAMTYSQDGNTNKAGGDLGYVKRGELEHEMDNIAFSLKQGQVSKPFQTSFGWHILKATDIRRKERRLSHILIKITTGYDTISRIKEKLNSFKTQVNEVGFDETSNLLALEIKECVLFKDAGDLVPEIGRIIGINNFLFRKKRKKDDLIGPFVGFDGNFYVFLVGDYIEPRVSLLEEIKEEIEERLRIELALDLAKKDAKRCFDEIKRGKSFNQAASIFSKKPRTTKFFSMREFVPEVPYSSEFYGLVFTMNKGDIGLTSTDKGTFITNLLERKDVNKEDFEKLTSSLFVSILFKKRDSILQHWFQELQKNSVVNDNRYLIDIY